MAGETKAAYLKACHMIEELQDIFWALANDPEILEQLTDTDCDIIEMIDQLYTAITDENAELQSGRRKED